jgi:hypothetical protein
MQTRRRRLDLADAILARRPKDEGIRSRLGRAPETAVKPG